jgi:hypothetical protein
VTYLILLDTPTIDGRWHLAKFGKAEPGFYEGHLRCTVAGGLVQRLKANAEELMRPLGAHPTWAHGTPGAILARLLRARRPPPAPPTQCTAQAPQPQTATPSPPALWAPPSPPTFGETTLADIDWPQLRAEIPELLFVVRGSLEPQLKSALRLLDATSAAWLRAAVRRPDPAGQWRSDRGAWTEVALITADAARAFRALFAASAGGAETETRYQQSSNPAAAAPQLVDPAGVLDILERHPQVPGDSVEIKIQGHGRVRLHLNKRAGEKKSQFF